MKSTRRLFLKETGLFAAATVLPVGAFSQEVRNAQNTTFDAENLSNLDGVSAETFARWIGSRMRVSLNGQARGSLVLIAVESKDSPAMVSSARSAVSPKVTSFLLTFRRTGTPLPQETYLLDHDWLGRFPLLLVPSGLPGPTSTCSAVFTLLDKKTLAL